MKKEENKKTTKGKAKETKAKETKTKTKAKESKVKESKVKESKAKESKVEVKKSHKLFNIIKSIFNIIIVILVLSFVLIVCLQRFSNNRISFFNYRMFTVVSGSMEPMYEIGDVLIAKEKDSNTIKVGDTISYLGSIGQFTDKVITHRVVDIEIDEDGKRLFHTKGIANLVEDPIVKEDQLYGVVIYKSIILSNVYRIVGTTWGMFIFVIIPIFYIIGSEFLSILLEKEEERRNKVKKA